MRKNAGNVNALDFMFQLAENEFKNLISQFVISSLEAGENDWGGRRTMPYVFTEQGIAMLSSVLKSKQAIAVNIQTMRELQILKNISALIV